jgi:mono/diheme cytochrome c family protein
MRAFLVGVVAALVLLAAGVWTVSRLGLYPIGADNPPSGVERTLAGRAMDVYASKHQPAGENPVAVTSAALIEGATEYERRCAFCHGGAKSRISPMRDRFNPPVPQLINRVPHDDEAWLFWVTKHGVRMTGMPTWSGVLSDDQIWEVVAFIKRSGSLPPDVAAAWSRAAADPARLDPASTAAGR